MEPCVIFVEYLCIVFSISRKNICNPKPCGATNMTVTIQTTVDIWRLLNAFNTNTFSKPYQMAWDIPTASSSCFLYICYSF